MGMGARASTAPPGRAGRTGAPRRPRPERLAAAVSAPAGCKQGLLRLHRADISSGPCRRRPHRRSLRRRCDSGMVLGAARWRRSGGSDQASRVLLLGIRHRSGGRFRGPRTPTRKGRARAGCGQSRDGSERGGPGVSGRRANGAGRRAHVSLTRAAGGARSGKPRVRRRARAGDRGGAAGERTHAKRFAPLAAVAQARVLQVTAPVLTRVVRDGATMAHALRRSSLPIASLSPAFRRASRPHGPIARRMPRPPVSARMIDHLANGDFIIDAAPARPGLVTLDVVLAGTGPRAPTALGDFTGTAIRRRRLPPSGPSTTRPAGRGGGEPAATADSRFRDAAAAHQDKLLSLAETAPPPAPTPIDVGDHSAPLLRRLKPSETLPARIGDRIRRPPNAPPPADPLAPIMASPQFPQPMYQPLRHLW